MSIITKIKFANDLLQLFTKYKILVKGILFWKQVEIDKIEIDKDKITVYSTRFPAHSFIKNYEAKLVDENNEIVLDSKIKLDYYPSRLDVILVSFTQNLGFTRDDDKIIYHDNA